MDNPLVSIIIPVYNKGDYLEETLRSALQQTWPNKEIIVIDDGSTDNSLEIAFSTPGLKIIYQDRKGASAARNRGIREAKGQYIQFLDADDLLHPEKIEKQLRCTLNSQYDLLCCNWSRFTINPSDAIDTKEFGFIDLEEFQPIEWLVKDMMVPVHAWLTPIELIRKAGNWNENLSLNDDGDFFTRVVAQCKKVIFHETWVFYRTGMTDSLSKKKDIKALESLYESYLSYEEVAMEKDPIGLKNNVRKRYADLFLKCYPIHTSLSSMAELKLEFELSDTRQFLARETSFISRILGIKLTLKIKTFIQHLL